MGWVLEGWVIYGWAVCSRLYVLQGVLAQQQWRIAELLHALHTYLLAYLPHPYKNVRDRIGR